METQEEETAIRELKEGVKVGGKENKGAVPPKVKAQQQLSATSVLHDESGSDALENFDQRIKEGNDVPSLETARGKKVECSVLEAKRRCVRRSRVFFPSQRVLFLRGPSIGRQKRAQAETPIDQNVRRKEKR